MGGVGAHWVENVELACNLAGITGRAALERARTLLERFDLGGEQQRVALARGLANDP